MAVLLSSAQPCRLKEFTERILPFHSALLIFSPWRGLGFQAQDSVSVGTAVCADEEPTAPMNGPAGVQGRIGSRPRVLQCGAHIATPAAPSCWERCRISQNRKLGVRPRVCSEQAFQVILMQMTTRLEARKNIWTFCKCSMIRGSLRETQTLAERQ